MDNINEETPKKDWQKIIESQKPLIVCLDDDDGVLFMHKNNYAGENSRCIVFNPQSNEIDGQAGFEDSKPDLLNELKINFENLLAQNPSVVISDYDMKTVTGSDTLKIFNAFYERHPELTKPPFILYTGEANYIGHPSGQPSDYAERQGFSLVFEKSARHEMKSFVKSIISNPGLPDF